MAGFALSTEAKHRAPLFKAFVGCQHGRRVLVAACHQLKEEHRAGAADRQITDLVDDQHRGMREDVQAGLQAARGLRFFQRRDQIRERAVIDAPAMLGRGDGETDRQVRLADAWGTEKDHIFATLDESKLVQALHLLPPQ